MKFFVQAEFRLGAAGGCGHAATDVGLNLSAGGLRTGTNTVVAGECRPSRLQGGPGSGYV